MCNPMHEYLKPFATCLISQMCCGGTSAYVHASLELLQECGLMWAPNLLVGPQVYGVPALTFQSDTRNFCKRFSLPEFALIMIFCVICTVAGLYGAAAMDTRNYFGFYKVCCSLSRCVTISATVVSDVIVTKCQRHPIGPYAMLSNTSGKNMQHESYQV